MHIAADEQTKMYLRCFMVLVAFSAASAADDICCFEDEYSIQEGGNGIYKVEGNSTLLSFYCRAVVQYPSQRTGAECMEYFPDNIQFRIVQEYKNGIQYYIMKNREGNETCSKQPLEGKLFEQCIPRTMKPMANFYFGRISSESVTAASYEIKKGVFATINAAGGTCAPMGVTIVGQDPVELATVGYFNYTSGLADPSLLNVPAICNEDLPTKPKMSPEIRDMNSHRMKKYYSLL